jgi:mRNA interferase RelE/StbE
MAQYEIQFKTSAAKEFRKLPQDIKSRIREAINALKTDPRPVGVKKLAGESNLYRIVSQTTALSMKSMIQLRCFK